MITSSDFTDRLLEPATGEAPTEFSYVFQRGPDGVVYTNVPHHVVHHSPSGFEWGYGGSGPADLALCLLEDALIRMDYADPYPPVDCYRGRCTSLAWRLHQSFKWAVIALLPHEGGSVPFRVVASWIALHTPEPMETSDAWQFPQVGPDEDYF